MFRRHLLGAALGLLPVLAPFAAHAADYPSKPITLVLPFAPGGPSDVVARLIANKLSANLKQPIVLLNTPGAGGMIASQNVARAEPDGYTLFYPNASTLTIAPQLLKKPGPEPLTQFVPIAPITQFSLVLVADPSVEANDLKQLVAYTKANPAKLSYASPGVGTTPHLIGELLKREAGVSIVHIPYNGGAAAVMSLLSGQANLFFEQPLTIAPHVKTGKLKALVTTGKTRLPSMPDVPTVIEAGFPTLTLESWSALVAPIGTPHEIVATLTREVNKVMQMPDVREAIVSRGLEPLSGTPEDVVKLINEDWPRWKALIKAQNIASD